MARANQTRQSRNVGPKPAKLIGLFRQNDSCSLDRARGGCKANADLINRPARFFVARRRRRNAKLPTNADPVLAGFNPV